MKERGLTQEAITQALARPEKMHASAKSKNRFIVKKRLHSDSRKHLLLIIFEKIGNDVLVITVIDTSKIDKYY